MEPGPLFVFEPDPPVAVIPSMLQGHGPRCAYFRHHIVDGRYAVSTIGEPLPEEAIALHGRYETRLFALQGRTRTPLGLIVHRTRVQADAAHRRLVEDVRRKLEEWDRRRDSGNPVAVFLLPGRSLD